MEDILQVRCAEMEDYIACFVQEAVKKDRKEPYSLCQLTVSLQHHLRENFVFTY